MTIGELVGSSGYALKVIVVFQSEPYGDEIQLKFNSGWTLDMGHILCCNVDDWKIDDESTIRIWSGDKLLWKVINS
jgi:hypothetical protein